MYCIDLIMFTLTFNSNNRICSVCFTKYLTTVAFLNNQHCDTKSSLRCYLDGIPELI